MTPNPTNEASASPSAGTAFPTLAPELTFLDEPQQKLAFTLNSFLTTSEVSNGNSVTISPDGLLIYFTRDNGRIDVHNALDGSFRFQYNPIRASPNFFPVQCQSGIAFGDWNGQQYAVYAIVDTPQSTSETDASSRIIAIAHPFNEVLFVSEPLQGMVQGTPFVTKGTFPGRYIFVTHNTNTMSSTLPSAGHFSVLDVAANGALYFTESIEDVDPNRILPYGPLGASHSPSGGKFEGGRSNSNDLVVWLSNDDMGMGQEGFIRGFQFPVNFQPEPSFSGQLGTVLLRNVRWAASAHPTLSEDGLKLFVGIRQSDVRAWVDDASFNDGASWGNRLDQDARAIPHAPVLSHSQAMVAIASAGNTLVALDSRSGQILWQVSTSFPCANEPKFSPDDQQLYTITQAGTVQGHDSTTGSVLWSFNCTTNVTNIPCVSSVQAEFSLSPDGTTLYYSDIQGNVRVLEIAQRQGPPLTTYPTQAPVTIPSISSIPSSVPSLKPSEAPSKVGDTKSPTVSISASPSLEPSLVLAAPSNVDAPTTSLQKSSAFRIAGAGVLTVSGMLFLLL